jgi:hypothetical protein
MATVISLLGLILSGVLGGGVQWLLEQFASWRNWHPDSRVKMGVAITITGILATVLAVLEFSIVPQYFTLLPVELQTELQLIAAVMLNQLTHMTLQWAQPAGPVELLPPGLVMPAQLPSSKGNKP